MPTEMHSTATHSRGAVLAAIAPAILLGFDSRYCSGDNVGYL